MPNQSSNINSRDTRRPLKIEGADLNDKPKAAGTFSLDTSAPNTASQEYPAINIPQGIKDPPSQWTERVASPSQPPIEAPVTLQHAEPEPESTAQPSPSLTPHPSPLTPGISTELQPVVETAPAATAPSHEEPRAPIESLSAIFEEDHPPHPLTPQPSSPAPSEALQAPQLAANPDTAMQERPQINLAPEAAQPVTSSGETLDLPSLESVQSSTGDIANTAIEEPAINPPDNLSAASSDQLTNNPGQAVPKGKQPGSILPFSILQKKPEEHIVSNQPTSRLMQVLPGQGDHKNTAFWSKAQEAKKGQKKAA